MNPTATLALAKWLKDRIREWESAAKRDLELLPGERKAAVVDGAVLGHVSMAKGRKSAKVIDEARLLEFVRDRHPTEVEVTERVRPAFLKQLLDDVLRKGALVDTDGVVVNYLVDVVEGEPYPISKLVEDADGHISGLLQRGVIGAHGLKAIEG